VDNVIAEGTKQLANSLNEAREAGKSLTKSIQNIQHDGVEVAQEQLEARDRHRQHEEAIANSMLFKAVKEYEKQSALIKAEDKAEKEFKAKYGDKEWSKVLELKTVVEKEHKENSSYYGHKLRDVKRVQFYCFFAAFVITCLLYYFGLV
jgi:ABC-type bacteriocin/lantibiotic exporter with double-glycine peptidase domain